MKTLKDFIKSGSEKDSVTLKSSKSHERAQELSVPSEKPETKDKVYDPILGREETETDLKIWRSI